MAVKTSLRNLTNRFYNFAKKKNKLFYLLVRFSHISVCCKRCVSALLCFGLMRLQTRQYPQRDGLVAHADFRSSRFIFIDFSTFSFVYTLPTCKQRNTKHETEDSVTFERTRTTWIYYILFLLSRYEISLQRYESNSPNLQHGGRTKNCSIFSLQAATASVGFARMECFDFQSELNQQKPCRRHCVHHILFCCLGAFTWAIAMASGEPVTALRKVDFVIVRCNILNFQRPIN